MKAEGSVVSQRILSQEIRIGTLILGQCLIALVQLDTITLNPGSNPCLIHGIRLTV